MVIHETYLPFNRQELLPHFSNERHLDEFVTSASRQKEFVSRFMESLSGMPITDDVRRNRQIEKDERIWTATTLKKVFDAGAMSVVLEAVFGDQPPFDGVDSWESVVGSAEGQELRFEVSVPSPKSYRDGLKTHYESHGRSAHLVSYVVDAAAGQTSYEGATQVDAIFRNRVTGFSVMFEAKVMSDTSYSVTFDPFRNQLARNVDVMLDEASSEYLVPDVSHRLFCLLTPDVFRQRPTTRHYGMLFNEYKRNSSLLAEHLPHRDSEFVKSVTPRLGWMTFEDCLEACPEACPWLPLEEN